MRAISSTVDLVFRVKVLRQVLFAGRAGNSILAKSLSENTNHPMYQEEDAFYPCKITKTNDFPPILVTSIHKTDSL